MVTRAFVTGIGGQDGSYLADRLVDDGLEVHALVLDADGSPEHCPPEVVLHPGDVTDVDGVRALLLDVDPHEVYNLAAISSVAQSWSEPDLTARVNGLGAVGLLESALAVQERHGHPVAFVQASSAEMFGEPTVSPQDEATPIRPVNPYGAAKAYAHLAVGVYRRRDLHAVGAILYNHESPRRPDRFVTRRITATVAAIARGRADKLVLGNLDSRRDWGWAPDYVDALVRAARADRPDDYVIATGVGHTVRDFAAAAFARAGIADWEPLLESDPALFRPADALDLTGDSAKAHRDLGWSPTVDFAEVVGRMVDADLAPARLIADVALVEEARAAPVSETRASDRRPRDREVVTGRCVAILNQRVGSVVAQELQQVRAVAALEQRLGDLGELVVGQEALPPGDLLGGADLGALPALDGRARSCEASLRESKVPVSSQAVPRGQDLDEAAGPARGRCG